MIICVSQVIYIVIGTTPGIILFIFLSVIYLFTFTM